MKTLDFVINHKKEVQSILYDPEVNLILNQSKNLIKFEKKSYQIPQVIQENLDYFVLNMPDATWETFDSSKVRLTSEITKKSIEENDPIILQKSSYFKDRLSNSIAKYKYQKANQILNLHNEFIKTETNEVITLNLSKLSNQLGASTLLFTKDNNITYLVQGSRTTENRNRWAPSGSGSFDFFIPKEKMSFKDYCLIQAKRELKEESNLKEKEILNIAICGFGRYIYRYGKPEIFCVATSSKMSDEIEIRAEEWDYQDRNEIRTFKIKGDITKKNLLEKLHDFKLLLENTATSTPLSNEFEQQVSGPLYWNVCFALDFFKAQPDEFIANFFSKKVKV
ncbi:hypothetical protein [Flagellimonas crocea]|uniref:hypothetical protein n=1 Tax=Flagellimonas crocea TaxID=3067311 RepID=UPI00297002D4|nr:hypothetical protein [Muricauda sp. DH64]